MPQQTSSNGKGRRTDKNQRPSPKNDFLVVGIGASAGGIHALTDFFSNVYEDSNVAYVVILHLSPDHDSQLVHILQQVTSIPVEQVTRKTKVEPNRIYVIPPDKSLTIEDANIVAKPLMSVEERRAPVDMFFRTLAEARGANSVAVVLSGTGANGSMGLKRIKERGGVTFAQNPREAEFNEMPRNAIATELVDAILPAVQIPAQIVAYRDRRKSIAIPDEPEDRPSDQQTSLREIFTQLRVRTGHDFSNYKRPTMLRRIERRISVRNLPDLEAYAAYLSENPDEPQALLKDLLISVTNFFRDKKAFEKLETAVIPRLVNEQSNKRPIRVWATGCATGEEAYSLAMVLAEQTMGDIESPPVQIFATDIDEHAIAVAREGLYTLNDAADVSPERLRRFFTKEGENYRIRREIRETVLFAQHNVLKDPPFSHLDLVTCRNLLIYLNRGAQERVMETAHFALRPGGYLFLGSSESVDGSSDLFAAFDKQNHIYQSRQVTSRPYPVPESVPVYRTSLHDLEARDRSSKKGDLERTSRNELHLRLLEELAPPSLVVDEEYEVVHLSARAGKYLQVVGGEPTNNLLRLIRPEIGTEVRGALFQARQQNRNVEVSGLRVRFGDKVEAINLLVRPVVSETDTARGFFLVVFEQSADDGHVPASDYLPPDPLARSLEEELGRSRIQLQSAFEQSEMQSEELRASNEELQALNEELRSSAEELETSKEELQSINEELITVNQELKVKIDELSHTNNDFHNLLNSIDIGVIFLDRGLRVNLFSPAAQKIFNLQPHDAGRQLTDITNKIAYEDLPRDADAVIQTLQTAEREVCTDDDHVFLMRIFPYRTSEDRISGVVVTFVDVTERNLARKALVHSEEQFRRAIEDAPIPVIMQAEDGEVLQVSRKWTELTGYTIDEVPDLDAWLTRAYGDGAENVRTHIQDLFKGDKESLNIEFQILTRKGENRYWNFSASPPGVLSDGRRFIVGMVEDITERQRADEALRKSEDRLQTIVEASQMATWEWDVGTGRVRWNDRHFSMFGLEPSSVELAVNDFLRFVHPDDRETVRHQLETSISENAPYECEFRIVRTDGQVRWMSGYGHVTHDEGKSATLSGVMYDVTERKDAETALRASEERMRRLMESFTDVALLTTDANSIVRSWNSGAEKVFGFTAEEMIGKQSADIIFTPEDREKGEPDKEKAIARRDGRAPDERWHQRKDGSRFYASGVMVPLTDGENLIGYGKIASDLTERKQFEERLKQAHEDLEKRVAERTEELRRSNEILKQQIAERRRSEEERVGLLRRVVTTQEEERSRIAREIHDQLGQRLTALRLKIAAIRDVGGDREELNERVDRLAELGAALDKEVSFLAWELRPTVLDDLGLVAAAENYVREWSQHFEVPAEFHSTGLKRKRLDPEIETNLYRIMQECLNNISKHSRASRANILLESRKKEVVLIIEDNGVGFDHGKLKPNRRAGSGLGLIGIRERAAISGGSVEIESSPGVGTTVFVRMPAVFGEKRGGGGC